MKKQIVFLIAALLAITSLQAQVKIGDNPQSIHPASVLELQSNNRVLVITRVSDAQMSTINPLRGAMVYNTDAECIHYFNGTEWINICEELDNSFTVSTEAVFNIASRDSTVVVTQTETPDGINYNFEVNRIRGENIVPRTLFGSNLAGNSITQTELQNDAVTRDKINLDVAGTGLIQAADGSLEVDYTAITPDWNNISNIPLDIADGDADNQNLSIGAGGIANQSVEVAISGGGTSALVDVR
ncbi:hypothetical protein ACFOWS_18945, partial [Flagellimonas marina]